MEFIKNKVIKRTLLSSIVPLILYSLVYAASGIGHFSFNNNYALITVLIFSVMYPFSQFSLWMLFAPIEAKFDRDLSNKNNHFLRGNFAAVDDKGDQY